MYGIGPIVSIRRGLKVLSGLRMRSPAPEEPLSSDIGAEKRLVSIPAEWRQGWQGSALAPSRNPVTQR